ncbi:MAG TPA: DUF2155 domain-containing protein [Caulobacteraceae bacterium]|jgi:hypothetical protein|nr:DUF2155 domain-containing protein [Caulobacteraceae bacterium]
MSRRRHLATLGLGAAVFVASVGLVTAQDLPGAPAAITGQAPPQAGAAPAGPVVALDGEAPPPEEGAAAPPPLDGARPEALPNADAEKKIEPMKRPRFTSAILQGVDKTTAETLRFEAKVGEPVRFGGRGGVGGLVITVHACEVAAPDEGYADAMVHLDVQAQPQAIVPQAARVIFRGWMFANSPGLHAVEHPLYDVWLIACKTAAPVAPGTKL